MKVLFAITEGFPLKESLDLLNHFDIGENTEFHCLSVIDIPHLAADFNYMPSIPYDMYLRTARKRFVAVQNEFRAAVSVKFPSASVITAIQEGHPGYEVLETSRKLKPDALVCGRKNAGPMERFFMGSVSSQILVHTEVPTFFLKPYEMTQYDIDADLNGNEPGKFKALIAYDGSLAARNSLVFLNNHLLWADETCLASVVPISSFFPDANLESELMWESVRRQMKTELENQSNPLREKTGDLKIHIENSMHSPASRISEIAASMKTDLIVCGKTGKSILGRVIIGSTSLKLAHTCHQHLLLIP